MMLIEYTINYSNKFSHLKDITFRDLNDEERKVYNSLNTQSGILKYYRLIEKLKNKTELVSDVALTTAGVAGSLLHGNIPLAAMAASGYVSAGFTQKQKNQSLRSLGRVRKAWNNDHKSQTDKLLK